MIIAVARMARQRFFSPEDIDGGVTSTDTPRAQLLQTLLQNTLEQSLIALLVYLGWALTMPATWLSVVPVAALAFAMGRILFFLGYEEGAAVPSPGVCHDLLSLCGHDDSAGGRAVLGSDFLKRR
jgi:hypothetical protein